MDKTLYEVESPHLFSESLLWQLNRDYYQETGSEAWSKELVPSHITNNSVAGKTYAELILGFLTDLADKGAVEETVYIVELGAGHGRLAYHILTHLEELVTLLNTQLPPYCYVLTDIVEDNLLHFGEHTQLQPYFKRGLLDYAYYDAIDGKELHLRHSKKTIKAGELSQAIIAIANYFFDSIPNDLYHVKNNDISVCSVSLHSEENPELLDTVQLIDKIQLTISEKKARTPYYSSAVLNDILEDYKSLVSDTYLFYPVKSILCLQNVKALSSKGLMLLTMDKGFHDIANIDKKEKPELITHGSLSIWVNYHAIGSYCKKLGGEALFSTFSTHHIQVGCLLFIDEPESFQLTRAAYHRYVNGFGPDDFNSIKKLIYANITHASLIQLMAIIRLSYYDSTIFLNVLPRLKQVSKEISFEQRKRIEQTLHIVWHYYFHNNEREDLAYSIAGLFFDLAFYDEALLFFEYSLENNGSKPDTLYNRLLCFYQLRQDSHFIKALKEAKHLYPNVELFESLDKLDLNAK